MYFRFTVGRYLKRIISQLSLEVTIKLKEEDKCLKYMNAEDFLIDIYRGTPTCYNVVSGWPFNSYNFGLGNIENLKFRVLGGCNKI